MVYKLGNLSDMERLGALDGTPYMVLGTYLSVLESEYGKDRNIDEADGGYVLYCTPGTDSRELKACFDYSKHTPEYADRYDDICATMYVITNEFCVTIVMSIADAPAEITREFTEDN